MLSKAFSRVVFPALFSLFALPAFSDSAVRIVRLSYVQDDVQIDRQSGQYEKAIINLPITAGTKLKTGTSGLAEVEFEDASTIRLAPDTALAIPKLLLRDSGEKVSIAELMNGTLYVNFAGRPKNELTLQVGPNTIVLTRSARLRISMNSEQATVAVFKGDIRIDGPAGGQEVKKKQTAKLNFSQDGAVILSKTIEQEPFDKWEKKQDQYHSRYRAQAQDGYLSQYGLADLAYYGSFFTAPGYGTLWQPYFVGTGWNPFMDGAWVLYPGSGFTWVSAYPWGWTPFHSGTWVFLSGYGWAWRPGGAWTNWYSQPPLLNRPPGFITPHPPTVGTTTVFVNRSPAVTMAAPSPGRLAVRSNSAGLGISRGQVHDLAGMSERIQNHPIPARSFNAPVLPSSVGYGGNMHGPVRPAQASAPTPTMHAPATVAPARAAPVHASGGEGRPHR